MVNADRSNGVVVDVLFCGTTFAAGATALCGRSTANVWTIEYDGRYRTTRNCYPDIMINHAGSNGDAEWNAVSSAPITSLYHA